MAFETFDPNLLLENNVFAEDAFLQKADSFDWSSFSGKKILVKGCSTIIPPWAYMIITAKLAGFAHSIRYGNEHDNIVVFRQKN